VRGPYHSHGTRLNSRNVVDAPRFPSGGPRDATPLRAPLSPITNLINPEFNNAPVIGGTPVRGPYHSHGTRLNSRNVVDAPTPLEGQGSENGINLPSVFPSSNMVGKPREKSIYTRLDDEESLDSANIINIIDDIGRIQAFLVIQSRILRRF
jgi:hypothetical protein